MSETTIQKATVEIQVMRVGNRQMTKAMFEQIEEVRYDENIREGEALGYVYGIKKDYFTPQVVCVILVINGELRKKYFDIDFPHYKEIKNRFPQIYIAV